MRPRSAPRSCILILLSAQLLLCSTTKGWCETSDGKLQDSTTTGTRSESAKIDGGSNTVPPKPNAQQQANSFEVTTEQEHVDTGENQYGYQLKGYFESLDCQNELLNDYNAFNRLSTLQSPDFELAVRQDRLWQLKLAKQRPEPGAGLVNIQAQDTAASYMTFADFANANKALKTFMLTMDGRDYADPMCNPYSEEFWYLLDKCSPSDIAIKIADKASALSYLPEREAAISGRRENFAARLKEIRTARLKHLKTPAMMAAIDQEGLWYEQLRQLNNAIKKHDRANTKRLIELESSEFSKALAQHDAGSFKPDAILSTITTPKYKLSWFGVMMQLSRQLSDSGNTALADKILYTLQTNIAQHKISADGLPLILAERAINQSRLQAKPTTSAKSTSNANLQALYKSMHMPQISEQQKLRWLGHLYDGAGYPERAKCILNIALRLSSQPRSTERILLLLDVAANAVHLDNFARATTLANEAVNNSAAVQIKKGSPEWLIYNKAYRCKVSDIAATLIEHKRFDEAKQLLLAAQSKINQGATKYTAAKPTDFSDPDGIGGILDSRLGQLYAQTNQPSLAVPYLKHATQPFDRYTSFVPARQYLLLGDCAKATGDYAEAAEAYALLARSTQHEPWRFGYINTDAQERYLTLALLCANKANHIDTGLRIDIIKELAIALKRHSPDDRLELELAAYRTVPDSSPIKQEIAASLAALASERTYKSTAHLRPSIDLRIKMLEQVAKLNEQSHPLYCAQAWRDLAAAEISDNRWQQAQSHYLHAIDMCSKESVQAELEKPFIAVWDVCKYDLPFGSEQTNEYTIGKDILIKATSKYEGLCTKESPQASLQAAQVVMFDIQHRQYQSAYSALDDLLKTNFQPIYESELNATNGIDSLISFVGDLDQSRILVSKNILQRILAAQMRDLPTNSFCIANTHYALAEAYAKATLYKEAIESYKNARTIVTLYGATMDDYDKVKANAEVMKQAGDIAGAATLLKSYLNNQKRFEVSQVSDTQDTVTLNNSHRIIAGDIAQALTEYRERLKTDPYSNRSEALLDTLLLYHRDDKDTTLLKELLLARLEIAKRVYYIAQGARTRQLSKLAEPYSKLLESLDKAHRSEDTQKLWQTIESNEVNYKRSQVAI